MSTQQLICPKCRGDMKSYERSGIVIDQCADCRGIFLDRGELERFVDLASRDVDPAPPMAPQAPQAPQWAGPEPDRSWRQQQPQQAAYQQRKHDWDDDSDDRHKAHGGGKYKKKKSFLSDMLDF